MLIWQRDRAGHNPSASKLFAVQVTTILRGGKADVAALGNDYAKRNIVGSATHV